MRFKILTLNDKHLLLDFFLWLTPEALEVWTYYGKTFNEKKVEKILVDSNIINVAGIDSIITISNECNTAITKEQIIVFGHLYNFIKDSCRLGIVSGIVGKGYGTLMMEKLILLARILFVKKIYLSTFQDNYPALALYKKFGFKIIKKYSDRPKMGYEMVCEL